MCKYKHSQLKVSTLKKNFPKLCEEFEKLHHLENQVKLGYINILKLTQYDPL